MKKNKKQTKEEVEAVLKFANSIISTLKEPFLVVDKDLRIISANNSFYTTFKVAKKETINQLLPDLSNSQWNIPKLIHLLKEVLPKKRIVTNYVVEHEFKTIGHRILSLNVCRIQVPKKIAVLLKEEKKKDNDSEEGLVLLAIEDITEMRKTQASLQQLEKLASKKESEKYFQTIFDTATDGILVADLENKKFAMGNQTICQKLGYSLEEIKKLGIKDIHPKKDFSYVLDQFERQVKGEFTLAIDVPMKKKDGTVFFADVNSRVVTLDGKKFLLGFFRDITVHKQTEEALKESEKRYRSLFETSRDAIMTLDPPSWNFTSANSVTLKMFGVKSEADFIIYPPWKLSPKLQPDGLGSKEKAKAMIDLAVKKGSNLFTWTHKRINGEEFFAEVFLSRVKSDEKIFLQAIVRDITDKKKIEEERKEQVRFLESLEQVNRVIKYETDIDKMLEKVVKTTFSIFNCDRAWLFYPCDPNAPTFRVPVEISNPKYPGAGVQNVDVPMAPDMAENLRDALKSSDPVIYLAGTKKSINKVTAEQFKVKSQMFIALYPKFGKPWVFGMHQCSFPRIWTAEEKRLFKEISRRISDGLSTALFLRELKESENRYHSIVELSPEGIAIHSEGKVVFANQTAVKLLGGKKMTDVIGLPVMNFVHTDSRPIIKERIQKMLKEGIRVLPLEEKFVRLDGSSILVETSAMPLTYQGKPAIQVMFRDITERKAAEEELESRVKDRTVELAEANVKLKELDEMKDEFLNITTHELKTPLIPIKSQLQLLLNNDFGQINPEQKKSLEMIFRNEERLNRLVSDVLDISRIESRKLKLLKEKVSLEKIIKNTIIEFTPVAQKNNIIIEFKAESLPLLLIDSRRISQVIGNLLNNAIKFTPNSGKIKVELTKFGNQALIKIIDTGIGISAKNLKNVFAPFFQVETGLTRKFSGSGLGLSICKGIIEAHNGSVKAESKGEGKGSTFSFTLPL